MRTLPRHCSGSAAADPAVWRLHVLYERTRCPEVLADLVEEYRAYVTALANRLHRDGESREELRQVAFEALIGALQRFECERGVPFPGFATPTIVGALKRHFRDQGWAIRVPRAVHEMAGPTRDAAARLTGRNGRSPTQQEIARELGIEPSSVAMVLSATRARSPLSLDAPTGPDDASFLDPFLVDHGLELAENHVALVGALDRLDTRSRAVLGMYYFDEMSQTDIADCYGVSQMQVSRWIHAALRRLRTRMSAGADEPVHGHPANRVTTLIA